MPDQDYYSEYSGSEIDSMLADASKAQRYAVRAEQALAIISYLGTDRAKAILGRMLVNSDSIGTQCINLFPVGEGVTDGSAVVFTVIDDSIIVSGQVGGSTGAVEDRFPVNFNGSSVYKLTAGKYVLTYDYEAHSDPPATGEVYMEIRIEEADETYTIMNVAPQERGSFEILGTEKVTISLVAKSTSGSWEYFIANVRPFLRREEIEFEEFSSYNENLQMQIDNLKLRVAALEGGGSRRSVIVGQTIQSVVHESLSEPAMTSEVTE